MRKFLSLIVWMMLFFIPQPQGVAQTFIFVTEVQNIGYNPGIRSVVSTQPASIIQNLQPAQVVIPNNIMIIGGFSPGDMYSSIYNYYNSQNIDCINNIAGNSLLPFDNNWLFKYSNDQWNQFKWNQFKLSTQNIRVNAFNRKVVLKKPIVRNRTLILTECSL